MSVIVNGIEIPENCFECPCCRHDNRNGVQKEQCNLTLDVFDAGYYERFEGRAHNCPLVTLSEKHGRLVDADALIAKYGDWYTEEGTEEGFIGTIEALLKDAPTVVEAEGEDA